MLGLLALTQPTERTYPPVINPVPWTPDIKWAPRLAVKAETYRPPSLFKVEPTTMVRIGGCTELPADQFTLSPNGNWVYSEVVLPARYQLDTFQGTHRGIVAFDGDVLLPRIHERRGRGWESDPWMSLSPMEVLTMRAGARYAKGETWIAGLGMGYLLTLVAARKVVKKIVVVEQSQELVDWILPKLKLDREPEIVIGNAKEIIPKTRGDAALIDIFPTWGGNYFPTCPGFKKVWVWGSSSFR